MAFIKYNRKVLGSFGKKIQCQYCGQNLKNCDVEMIENCDYYGGNYTPMYFCYGHLIKYFKKLQREFLLEKI